MSGAIAQSAASIPQQASLEGLSRNPLGGILNVNNVEQSMVNTRAALAKQRAAQIYQKSIDPNTGLPDPQLLGNLLSKDPEAAMAMQDVQSSAQTLATAGVGTQQATANLNETYGGMLSHVLSGEAGTGKTPAEARADAAFKANALGIPPSIYAPAIENITDAPSNLDPQAQQDWNNANLLAQARVFAPTATQAQDLTPEISASPSGSGFIVSQAPAAVMAPTISTQNNLRAGLAPSIQPTMDQNGNSVPTIIAQPPSGGSIGGGLPGTPAPVFTTNPSSVVPNALMPPPSGGAAQPPPAAAPPSGGNSSAAGGGATVVPLPVVSGFGDATRAQINNYTNYDTQLQAAQRTAGQDLGLYQEGLSALANSNPGKMSNVTDAINNIAAEFGGPGEQGASAQEILNKITTNIATNALPGGLGAETDYQTQLGVTARASGTNAKEASQAILSFGLGVKQSTLLAAALADKAGVLGHPGLHDSDMNFYYKPVQQMVGKINPMVFTYENMDAENRKAFLQGLSKDQRAQFREDQNYVQGLVNSLQSQ